MMKIGFYVSGNPIGKERPRKGKYGNFYTPQKTHLAEERIWLYFWIAATEWTTRNSGKKSVLPSIQKSKKVRVDIKCFFATKRHADLDNIQKLVWDALGDCQGERLGDDKRFYGSIDFEYRHEPGLQITVTW